MFKDDKKYKLSNDGIRVKDVVMIILIIVLVIAIALGVYYDQVISNEKSEEYEKLNASQKQQELTLEEKVDARAENVLNAFSTYLPGIVCWGDSFTIGVGVTSEDATYPAVLQNLIQENIIDNYDVDSLANVTYKTYREPEFSVVNRGGGYDDTYTVLGRNGAVPFLIQYDFVIPADQTQVEIHIVSSSGKNDDPQLMSYLGLDYVIIDGVKGTLEIDATWNEAVQDYTDYVYYFTREEVGEEVAVSSGTEVITSASQENLNDIPIIWIGEYGGYDTAEELVEQINMIIDHQSDSPVNEDGTKRFIVLGLTTGMASERSDLEQIMSETYGDQYINLREYLSTQGLTDASITPTEEDSQMILQGMTPASLLASDYKHLNDTGYSLVSSQIYQRMSQLGYFDEVNSAIEEAMEPIEE